MKRVLFTVAIATWLFSACTKEKQTNQNSLTMNLSALKERISNPQTTARCNNVAPTLLGSGYQIFGYASNYAEIDLYNFYHYFPAVSMPAIIMVQASWTDRRKIKTERDWFWVSPLVDAGDIGYVTMHINVPVDVPIAVTAYGISLCSINTFTGTTTIPAQTPFAGKLFIDQWTNKMLKKSVVNITPTITERE